MSEPITLEQRTELEVELCAELDRAERVFRDKGWLYLCEVATGDCYTLYWRGIPGRPLTWRLWLHAPHQEFALQPAELPFYLQGIVALLLPQLARALRSLHADLPRLQRAVRELRETLDLESESASEEVPPLSPLKLSRDAELLDMLDTLTIALGRLDSCDVASLVNAITGNAAEGWPPRFRPAWIAIADLVTRARETQP